MSESVLGSVPRPGFFSLQMPLRRLLEPPIFDNHIKQGTCFVEMGSAQVVCLCCPLGVSTRTICFVCGRGSCTCRLQSPPIIEQASPGISPNSTGSRSGIVWSSHIKSNAVCDFNLRDPKMFAGGKGFDRLQACLQGPLGNELRMLVCVLQEGKQVRHRMLTRRSTHARYGALCQPQSHNHSAGSVL